MHERSSDGSPLARIGSDSQWWLALSAGPAFWLALAASSGLGDVRWPAAQPLLFLQLTLLAPVLEEFVFRGGLQTYLLQRAWGSRRLGGISAANALTSAAFAALHLWQHAPLWAAATFVPSLIFGHFRDRYARVLPCVLLHVFYNTGYFWLFGRAA